MTTMINYYAEVSVINVGCTGIRLLLQYVKNLYFSLPRCNINSCGFDTDVISMLSHLPMGNFLQYRYYSTIL